MNMRKMTAIWRSAARTLMLGVSSRGRSEQPLRPEDEDQSNDERRQHLGESRREEHRDDAVAEPDDQRRSKGALQTAESADDDDDEGEQQRVLAHQIMRLLNRHDQHRGNAGEHRACRKNNRIDAIDGYAKGLGGL